MSIAGGATALGAKATFVNPASLVNSAASNHLAHTPAAAALPHALTRTNSLGSGSLFASLSLDGSPSSSYSGQKLSGATQKEIKQSRKRQGGALNTTAAFGNVLGGLFGGSKGDDGSATAKKYASNVEKINGLEARMQALSDEELRQWTTELQRRVRGGESLDIVLPVAFAVVREASKRVLGLRPFDVQLIGGMVLHKGEIAEMRTGEGKTLVAVLPAFLNALSGKSVHVVTVNDYLARRDCEWVGQVHRFLGLKVGLIQAGMTSEQRRESYAADITYVTNSELGFDYLRDNIAGAREDLVLQREFSYCIIDEVDSILIDEARTPLIISGESDKPGKKYEMAAKIASIFERDFHYTVDEKAKSVVLQEKGYEDAEAALAVKDLYDPREQWASYILNAIKAKELFLRDVNYIVKNGEIYIVDEFTGRVMEGRRWSEGLHQAVEAKEGLEVRNETVTLASISYQNFFLQYPKICGMTGTAATEANEFKNIYKLDVTCIPTNRPMVRKDESDVVFRSVDGKWRAAVVEVVRIHKQGRPVLVGTTSVEQSELISEKLTEAGIKHSLLNAKPENVEREAEIVAQSGRRGAVTIATNMAGRGTDIILGGNAEYMAKLKLREVLMPKVVRINDEELPNLRGKRMIIRSWRTSPDLYPAKLKPETLALAEEAAKAAEEAWGTKAVPELEAEERLSIAAERAPTSDPVIAKLREAFNAMEAEFKTYTDKEKEEVIKLGGLHVVGTERHESRRIDNQLRGRSGRQGDPGSTRYFLSLEDNLFRVFGGDRMKNLMTAFRIDDLPLESRMLTSSLDEAQKKVEQYYYELRKQLFEYDEVLNSQREKVYADRRQALVAESLEGQMIGYAERTMDDILEANIDPTLPRDQWPMEPLVGKLIQYCWMLEDLTPELLNEYCPTYDSLRDYLRELSRNAYLEKRRAVEELKPGLMDQAERFFVLSQTDNLWKEHLQAIKFVQQAVGLRGYGQKDPLIEYKLEGYNLFLEMMAQIRRNVIYSVYQFQPVIQKNEDGSTELASKPSTEGSEEETAIEQPVAATNGAAANGVSEKVAVVAAASGARQGAPVGGRQPKGKGRSKRR
ncbi:preprotein translocase SecA [Klebsormidium nitens]|uniref:Protein translocase subunit SecA n=1 Tax=Klebsormidium nitens TaxID=105231 RepID=A0A1Y1HNI5_KLENI|nr:preprotein translocase SecA [Klebsormidium nitens]|eukprot:GAQ80204.1 preprotein translocase SecA [Klebsormidium nitens]